MGDGHTCGPWVAAPSTTGGRDGRGRYEIRPVNSDRKQDIVGWARGGRVESKGNADLMAGSPVMLGALVRVDEWLDRLIAQADRMAQTTGFGTLADAARADARNYRAVQREIRAAIAAATGGDDGE